MNGTPKSARGVPPPPPPAGLPRPLGAEEPHALPDEAAHSELAIEVEPAAEPEAAPERWRDRRKNQLAADTLFELDAPSRAVTRDLDVEIETGFLESGAGAVAEPAAGVELEENSSELTRGEVRFLDRKLLNTEVLSAVAAPSETPEQQRLRRVVTRLLACRDCFRWLGSLGIGDDERRSVSRLLLELDPAAGVAQGRGVVIKDPDAVLKQATPEQLDAIERLLGPIEDRLLALDDLVAPAAFRTQLENRKQSKKIIARYGRLLASRRFPVGRRRDRFELIATHLLTADSDGGLLRILPPERARAVLDHLVGGLPKKAKDQAKMEAISHLREAVERLSELRSADEFFDSGYYLDIHGYKVSNREQLTDLEFLYLSVLINVEVHNHAETWIAELELKRDAKQFTQLATPREQIMRRLREQEEAVDDSFGQKRKSSGDPTKRSDPSAHSSGPAKKAKASPAPQRKERRVVFDRELVKGVAALLVLFGALGYIAYEEGAILNQPNQALDAAQLARLSPLLGRGWIRGEGRKRELDAMLVRKLWLALDPRARREQAEQLAASLRRRGIQRAEIAGSGAPAIAIENGLVSYVQGGKL